MSGYIGTQPVPQATQTRDSFTATANQTSFATSGYTPEFLDVFLNGVKLAAADYTATNGSDVVLASGATVNDILEVVAYSTFEELNPTFDGNVTFTGNASFGDNDKAIFGDGNDLQIYHDGTHSRIVENNATGQLKIQGNNMQLLTSDGASTYLEGNASTSAVTLYHASNAPRLATTSTGIDVTGTVNADGLVVSAANANIDVSATGTGFASQDFLTNSNAARTTIGVERSSGGGLFVGSSAYAAVFGSAGANPTQIASNNTIRMTVDTSGNVLVGKTSPDFGATAGTEFRGADGRVFIGSTDGAFVNRIGSDGSIISFRKDGTTVGSIGSTDGTDLQIGSGNCYLRFDDATNQILPTNAAGTKRNSTFDLGASDARFKDAYLSGGIYLGGTGSANKLDDYEEGTWTPTLIAVSGGAITFSGSTVGIYTKIGRLVHISFSVDNFSVSGGTGGATINIGGLPFTTQGSGIDSNGAVLGSYNINWSRTDFVAVRTYAASTLGFLVSNNNGTWMWENINAFSSGSGKYLNGTITYMTTQ